MKNAGSASGPNSTGEISQSLSSNIPDQANMFTTPNTALLNVGNMFPFPQRAFKIFKRNFKENLDSNAPFNTINATANPSLTANLAAFFPQPNSVGGFPQFIQPQNLLGQTNSNPFAAPVDSPAAVVGGGRESILPLAQSSSFQQNVTRIFKKSLINLIIYYRLKCLNFKF